MQKKKRKYNSASRKKKSEALRRTILEAAKSLFTEHGINKTTIDRIALAANVAPPTVYAAFKSKSNIVSELGQTFVFGEKYISLVKNSHSQEDPRESLRMAPTITVSIFEMEMDQMPFLWVPGPISEDLQKLVAKLEVQRFERQKFIIDRLSEKQFLKNSLDKNDARDILWAQTGRELFRKFVIEKKWSHDDYTRWLESCLFALLLESP